MLIHTGVPWSTQVLRVTTGKLPARSPNLNANAERFVRSIKSECLAQMIPLGERPLREVVNQTTVHSPIERNHQGLDNKLIDDQRVAVNRNRDVECRERFWRHPQLLLSKGGVMLGLFFAP